MKNKIIKWLDFNFWWVFINGYKQDDYWKKMTMTTERKKKMTMTTERRKKIDEIVKKLSLEFKENASFGDGNFGVLYLSCDVKKVNFQISLEANRVTFKHMILSMMNANEKVAEDIIDVVENHYIARS